MTTSLHAARVQESGGLLVVELSGEPYERGRQHGEALRSQVQFFRDRLYGDIIFKRGRAFGAAFTAVIYGLLTRMHPHIPRELREEMRGVADGARVSYRDIVLLNSFDDVLHGLIQLNPVLTPLMNHRFIAPVLGRLACSSFVVTGERSREGRPIHGRNLDYYLCDGFIDPEGVVPRVLREHVVVFVVRPNRGRPFASVAWPGFVSAITALNADGLSLACLTSTVSRETANGVPLPLLYRLVAQYAGSVEEAEWLLRGARRTIGNNLTVSSGSSGDARLFEFTMERLAALRPRDGVILATNHFQHPAMVELQEGCWIAPNSGFRLTRLQEIFAEGRFDAGDAQAALTDACPADPGEQSWDCIQNPGTVYSTVADPARFMLWVRVHDGANRPFVELDLADPLGAQRILTAA
jgi:isopenicillin-N N-acyltransferase like protein